MTEHSKLPLETKIEIEIIDGVEGQCLSINNYRVAGPKPWGAGTVSKIFKTSKEDILRSINCNNHHKLVEALTSIKALLSEAKIYKPVETAYDIACNLLKELEGDK